MYERVVLGFWEFIIYSPGPGILLVINFSSFLSVFEKLEINLHNIIITFFVKVFLQL